ncbi:MAG: FitA-like ribbon-helix-helix domain-containing protein [Xanthobacteraceae bacterium]|jgi:FtsZ-binding cell division protein ZapB
MPDLLVRGIDPETYKQIKKTAKANRQSLAQAAREALAEKFKPSKQELWTAADRLRAKIGKVSGDSTTLIREDRDSDEPRR